MFTNLYWRSVSLFPFALFLLFLLSRWPVMESRSLDNNYTMTEELNTTYHAQDLKVNNSHGIDVATAGKATSTLNSHSIAPSTSTINYEASTSSASGDKQNTDNTFRNQSNYFVTLYTSVLPGTMNTEVPQSNPAGKQYISSTTMSADAGGFNKSQFLNNSELSGNANYTMKGLTFAFSVKVTGTTETTNGNYSTVTTPSNSKIDISRILPTEKIILTTNGNTSPQPKYTENYGTLQNSTNSLGTEKSTPTLVTTETDVDECQRTNHCLPFSHCVSLYKSFTCECELGFYYSQIHGCIPARTFLGQLFLPAMSFKEKMSVQSSKEFRDVQVVLENIFKAALNSTNGYLSTIITDLKSGSKKVTVLTYYSLSSNVTKDNTWSVVKDFIQGCENVSTGCEILRINGTDYQSDNICESDVCDASTTSCVFHDGIVECVCLSGYLKYSEMDRSCKACESGFQLKDGLCLRCPFGFSGFNCSEWLLLLLVIIAGTAGPVLLCLIITVIVLSCR
ncbi:protein HEG-like [Protopterus annectens]|uniref:protein HEG-like n=1 Tax=Protopterus annectens TaxID=7888 RepID=UPI001CFA7CA6|nr:protein HEG-like [Protopterus annectens]